MASNRSFRYLLATSALLTIALATVGTRQLVLMGRAGSRVEEVPRKRPPSLVVHGQPFKYTVWEAPRYLDDRRPFLVKFKEIAAEIEVFPFQWLAFPGAYSGYLHDNQYVTHKHAQRFYHFADLARQAKPEDLVACIEYLTEASPKEEALLLVVLHFSIDDAYLPVIARSVGDYSIAFPIVFNQESNGWRREHRLRLWGESLTIGNEVKQKSERRLRLNYFEQRVLQSIHRYEPTFSPGEGPEQRYRVETLKYVSDYAVAILRLRGCGLVESIREMSRFRGPLLPGSYMEGYEEPPTPELVFTEQAWDEFRSMSFQVRRLRCEYILQVECVAPPYQEEALAKFVKRLQKTSPRIAALAFFSISPDAGDGPKMRDLLISDWAEYVRRIPRGQIEELLTSPNLDTIDADLEFERQVGGYVVYRPYYNGFFLYVLQHRSQWFDCAEFAEIERRLTRPAKDAWKTVKRTEDRP